MSAGPRLTLEASCNGCQHEQSESYTAQSDSGHMVYCLHPQSPKIPGRPDRARIGDTTWTTPKWCPLMGDAVSAFLAAKAGGDP